MHYLKRAKTYPVLSIEGKECSFLCQLMVVLGCHCRQPKRTVSTPSASFLSYFPCVTCSIYSLSYSLFPSFSKCAFSVLVSCSQFYSTKAILRYEIILQVCGSSRAAFSRCTCTEYLRSRHELHTIVLDHFLIPCTPSTAVAIQFGHEEDRAIIHVCAQALLC